MDSYRQTLAVHYLGSLRPEETITLSERSVRVGSDPSCHFCVPSDALGQLNDARPLLWQFVTGRNGVVVRNWSSHGHWNGRPFSDVQLNAGDQLTVGEMTLELVPVPEPLATSETSTETTRFEVESSPPISQLESDCTPRPTNVGETAPSAGLPAIWHTFLQSERFSGCTTNDITSIDEAIEFVADRLDRLQSERDEFEVLCHELSAKVETLETDFGNQSRQLQELQAELTSAVTELRDLRTLVEDVAGLQQEEAAKNEFHKPAGALAQEIDLVCSANPTWEMNLTQSEVCPETEPKVTPRVPLNQSADLSSMIDAMEHEVDEFTQLSAQSDSILYPRAGNPTTRSFIEESRLLEELESIHDDVSGDRYSEEAISPPENNSDAEDLTRTMVVKVDLDDDDEEPLRPLAWDSTHSSAADADETDDHDRSSGGNGNAPEFHVPKAAPPVSAASILESMGVLPEDYDVEASPTSVATAVPRPVERAVPEEDLSIQQYMEQLLQRLGGTSPQVQASSISASVAEPAISPHSDVRTSKHQLEQLPTDKAVSHNVEASPVNAPQRTARMLESHDDDVVSLGETISAIKSRVMSTEITSDLAAMRELANISARTAIDHHVRQRWGYAALGKVAVSVAALVTAVGLSYVSKSWLSVSTWGAAIALVIAAFWAFQAVQIGRLVLSASADAKAANTNRERPEISEIS